MAKRKSFDPDALAKLQQVGKEIADNHKNREQEFLNKAKPKKENSSETEIAKNTIEKVEHTKVVAKKTTKRRSKTTAKVVNTDEDKTSLCRIGADYHKRLKMEAVKKGTTIRNLLEHLIQENIPAV